MSDHDAQVRNLAARAFWIGQGLYTPIACALADYGVLDFDHLTSMGRTALSLVPGMTEVGLAAIDTLLSRRAARPG